MTRDEAIRIARSVILDRLPEMRRRVEAMEKAGTSRVYMDQSDKLREFVGTVAKEIVAELWDAKRE